MKESEQLQQHHLLRNLLLSCLSGIFARTCTYPIDTLRTQLQVMTEDQSLITRIRALRSFRSLFRGILYATSLTAPATAIYLTSYDYIKSLISHHYPILPHSAAYFSAACTAEVLSATFWTPMEVIKQKVQAQPIRAELIEKQRVKENLKSAKPIAQRIGSLEEIKFLFQKEGLRGFYKGYFAQLMVFLPYSCTYFVLYEAYKDLIISSSVLSPLNLFQKSSSSSSSVPISASCSVVDYGVLVESSPLAPIKLNFAGYLTGSTLCAAISSAVTCPLDVVKTRLQVDLHNNINYRNPLTGLYLIWKTEGARTLWRGLSARVLFVAPSTALSISCYELLKNHFESQ
eukprot:TRINITY_DN5879_c0_g4_i1.p1 TRINITY_DN5879_c0_g4~~TRINITY_DN5879_c0_g4_i1.p1  ORF type:complete len:358 (+),score=74.85 TRINITY_DN5879_c0_g4_i1:44-1075(+)